jgi:hypothetical protein
MLGWVKTVKDWFDHAADHYTGAGKLREENESLKVENKKLSDRLHEMEGGHHRVQLSVILLAVLFGLSLAVNLFFLFLERP